MLLLAKFCIEGHSMHPTLHPGETVLVSYLPYLFFAPKTGDIVALTDPSSKKTFLKRIKKISNSKYYITGDNQNDSKDSRMFGWIPRSTIVGKMIARV